MKLDRHLTCSLAPAIAKRVVRFLQNWGIVWEWFEFFGLVSHLVLKRIPVE
jgi:hypothetical protein